MKKWFILMLLLLAATSVIITSAQSGEVTPEPQPVPPVDATPSTLNPLLGFDTPPPFDITLPEGWELVLRDTFTYQDVVEDSDGILETVPIDVYTGPVSGGRGWIVVPWGYDSVVPFEAELTAAEYPTRAAWLDGLRMLQFVVFDARCTMGTAPQRDYTVGDLTAVGTAFQAVDCPFDFPDTRGWFASLNVGGLNFSFVAYVDPLQPAGSSFRDELQVILDSVVFRVDEITITGEDFRATQQAVILTPRATLIFEEAPTTTPTTTP